MDQVMMVGVGDGWERPAAGELDQHPAGRLVTITTAADWLGLSRSPTWQSSSTSRSSSRRAGGSSCTPAGVSCSVSLVVLSLLGERSLSLSGQPGYTVRLTSPRR